MDCYYLWLGIPPAEQPPNHYRLLGLRLFESNPDVIQNAADRQMAHLGTFQNGPYAPHAQRLLQEVGAACYCLLRSDLKPTYDYQLMQIVSRMQAQPQPVSAHAGAPYPSPGPLAMSAPLAMTAPLAAAAPLADSGEEEDDSDAAWDSSQPSSPRRRARRMRRQSEGNFALLGLGAVLVVAVAGALAWRSLSRQVADAQPSPQPDHAHRDVPQHSARAEHNHTPGGGASRPKKHRPAADMEETEPQAEAATARDRPAAAAAGGNSASPSGGPQVASAFAGRLDPRMNPDLESILGTENAASPGMTGPPTADPQGWEDGKPTSPKQAAFDPVNLGAGLVLSMPTVDLAPDSVALMIPAEADAFVRKNSEGAVTGAFSLMRGVLNGPVVELNAANRLALFGAYENGERDGGFRLWGPQQRRLLYSQYAGGTKRGLTCVFKNSQPRYVEVSDQRGVKAEFLIHFTGRKPQVIAKRDFSPDDANERRAARARLTLLEATLTKHEHMYQAQSEAWWEGGRKRREPTAAAGGRANASGRGPARGAKLGAYFSALIRGGEAP